MGEGETLKDRVISSEGKTDWAALIGLFLPFMLAGLWLALRQAWPGRSAAGWLSFSTTPLALVLLSMRLNSLLHILTWAMPRCRLPVDA